MQRTGKLCTGQLNHIRIIGKVVQALTNVSSMQLTSHRMIDIIEHIRHKNAFIACKRNRFREVRFINIITASPRTVHPMCTGFQNIMLEIVLMEQEQSFSTTLFRKFFQTCPIPCIGTVQIIFTQAFPGNALTATSERLFIKGAPYISIAPTDAFMVIPATIIPKSVILVKYEYIIPLHKVDD